MLDYDSLLMCPIQARVQHFCRTASPFHAALHSTDQTLRWGLTAWGNCRTSSGIAKHFPALRSHCYVLCPKDRSTSCTQCKQTPWPLAGPAWSHSAGAKKPFQVRMPVICLPLAFASKLMLPKHTLKFIRFEDTLKLSMRL